MFIEYPLSHERDPRSRQPPSILPLIEITIEAIVDDPVLDRAFEWLVQRRIDWPPHADVWRFRRNWPCEKSRLRQDLLDGTDQMGLLDRVILHRDSEAAEVDLWPARDAVVMKALAWLLGGHLPLSPGCMHVKGHGGLKATVRQVFRVLPQYSFVLKTDVKSYYASIDHQRLTDRLAAHITDGRILNLIGQYLRRCAERGGLYWTHRKGIALGSPLSPVIGAFFLTELDEQLSATGLFWRRYMDDIVVLAPTRWKLRRVVKMVYQVLDSLGLEMHPDKTFIGRVDQGFDFLGYHIQPTGLAVARQTLDKFVARMWRLYEQERKGGITASPLAAYVRRWMGWIQAGIDVPVKLNWATRFRTTGHTELHLKDLNQPSCTVELKRIFNRNNLPVSLVYL